MNRGIVMEVQKRSVLVLTPEGEFVKCKKQHREYEVGEEILFPQVERIKQRSKILFFSLPKRFALAASSALIACLFLFFYGPAEEKAMAYVAVDINPSLEMSVDSKLHVMNIEAYNEEGRRVLSKLQTWEDEPLSEVIRAIVGQSKQDGYLKADKQVTITSVAASEADEQTEKRIDETVTEVQKACEKEAVTVVYQTGTLQVREDAKRAGISTGRYMKQEKERLQQKQEANQKLEQAPAAEQEQPKSAPVQPSAPVEQQKKTPAAPKNNSGNHAPPQQRKTEKEEQKTEKKTKREAKEEKRKEVSKKEERKDK